MSSQCQDMIGTPSVRSIPPLGHRPGKLVMVGSGIKSIAHMTLETVAHIEQADKVFYCVADPGTEAFIKARARVAIDLYTLYDNDKNRYSTYVQMAEKMLSAARAGHFVVGVFYGHPGVFVSPSHRAIGIAQREGIEAYMLPGISAEDCLFSDLNIDPSATGCQTVEATDLVLRDRPLLTSSHVIIWQVGVVGDTGFNFQGFKHTKLQVLVDRLEEAYGADHAFIHYFASTLSHCKPHIEPLKIGDLRQPEIAKRITGISTFYIPAKSKLPPSQEMATRMGLRIIPGAEDRSFGCFEKPNTSYSAAEMKAVKDLDTHTTPSSYKKNRLSSALLPVLEELATSPKALTRFKRNPERYLEAHDEITPHEKTMLKKVSTPGVLRLLSQSTSLDVAMKFVQAEFRDPTLAKKYGDVLKQNNGDPNGETNIITFLKQQGYDTTPEDVNTAYLQAISVNIDSYDGLYASTFSNGGAGPSILIQAGTVTANGTKIKNPIYSQSLLQWSTKDGNDFNAQLTFRVITSIDDKPLPADSYIGPQFYGTYWKDAQPTSPNIQGKTGTAPPKPVNPADPVAPITLDTFSGNFVTYLADATGKYSQDSTFVISDSSGSPPTTNAEYKGKKLVNYKYSGNEALSWSSTDGNDTNGAIGFYINKTATKNNPTLGAQAIGRVWAANDKMPDKPNFFMLTGQSANPQTQSQSASASMSWKAVGINFGIGLAVMITGAAILEVAKLAARALSKPGPDIQKQLADAIKKLNEKLDQQEAVENEGVESDLSNGGELNPVDLPPVDPPVVDPPVVDPPVVDPPVVDPPVVDPPVVDPPVVDPPVVDPPVIDPPVVDPPVVDITTDIVVEIVI